MKSHPITTAGLLLLMLIGNFPAIAQSALDDLGWSLRKDEASVQVFSRKLADNPVHEFKGVTIVQGNIDSAFMVMKDVKRLLSTDPVVHSVEILKWEGDDQLYVWQEVQMPFWMKDRDAVSKVHYSPTPHGYITVAESVADYIPRKKGLVRVQNFRMTVGLHQLDSQSFEMQYKITIWPSGGNRMTVNYTNKAFATSTFRRLQQLRTLVGPTAPAGKQGQK